MRKKDHGFGHFNMVLDNMVEGRGLLIKVQKLNDPT